MKLRKEIQERFRSLGPEGLRKLLFEGLSVPSEAGASLMASLMAGHHILLTGPPGVGKTELAKRVGRLLGDRTVVEGCPLNCELDSPSCPWCVGRLAKKEELTSSVLAGAARVQRVSGSAELKAADLVGDFNPQSAIKYGLLDLRAFVPGKLLRANGCILLMDFMDRVPERVMNTILAGLAGEGVTIGNRDERFPMDILVVGTGSAEGLSRMPMDLADHFDRVPLDNVSDAEYESGLLSRGRPSLPWVEPAMKVVRNSRSHSDLARGISTRGAIRYGELLGSFAGLLRDESPTTVLPPASTSALPHRVNLASHAVSSRSAAEVIQEIVDEALGNAGIEDSPVSLSTDKMLAIVDEIARTDHFRKPLKFGLFDLLLKRIKRFPDSEFSRLHRRMMDQMLKRTQDQQMQEDLTFELLADIDEVREKQERLSAELRARLEEEALIKTLNLLEDRRILSAGERGYRLSRKGIALLLEKLAPRLWESGPMAGFGKHRSGKKIPVGEGRVVGTRAWRFGDSYRDFSLKDTIRQAIRNRHQKIARQDLRVMKRDIRTRMDILLCLDLSGTMEQLEKLWYAKEGAIALALASSQYGDRMGLVTFSNMAGVVSDLTDNTYLLTEKVLDLDLHENAFTNVGYGLLKARSVFARHSRSHGKQHIILVSDGDATAPHPSPARFAVQEAARTVRKGITISCICINEENANPDLMQKIARIGRGRINMIESTMTMRDAVLKEHSVMTS